jgi:RHS repeat-associated protein
VTASYAYDALGRRKAKTVNGTTTIFVSDGDRQVLEYDGSTGQVLRRYAYGPGLDEAVGQIGASGARQILIPDIQGSIVAEFDSASGAVTQNGYRPYGESADATGSFRYAGRRIDAETALYDYRARIYSPALGRFLQPDPIGYRGGNNLYAYVDNDPLNATDPTGLLPGDIYNVTANPHGIGSQADVLGQSYFLSTTVNYSHSAIEIASKDGVRRVAESEPGIGVRITSFDSFVNANTARGSHIDRFVLKDPLSTSQIQSITKTAESLVGNSSYNWGVMADLANPLSKTSFFCAEFCNYALKNAGEPSNVISNIPAFLAVLPGDIASSPSFVRQQLDVGSSGSNPRLHESVGGK